MKPSFRSLAASLALAALCAAPAARAHEAWVEPALLVHFGEPGESLDAVKLAQVRDASALAADGSKLSLQPVAVGEQAVILRPEAGPTPAVVFFTMDLAHYIVDGENWTEAPAAEARKAPKSWSGSYTVISLLAWTPSLVEPRDRNIELVPEADPFAIAPGGELILRAYRHGKPVAGVKIGDGEAAPLSDADGRIRVFVKQGRNIILGNLKETEGGHTTSHLAVLSFTRP